MFMANQLYGFLVLTVCTCQLALAQGVTPRAEFKTKEPRQKELVIEYVYSFREVEFDPPIQIKPFKSSTEASYDSPEAAVMSHFSAMYAKDYQWFQRTWSKESQKLNEEDDRKKERTSEFWLNLWDKVLSGKRVELTHRIESGKYVLINYRLIPISGGPATFEDLLALTTENGRWVLTQELASDPLLRYWNTKELKIRRTIR
jgi:hypothetical protein